MNYSITVKKFQLLRIILYLPILVPSIVMYSFLNHDTNLAKDLVQWKKTYNEVYSSNILLLLAFLTKYKDFRNLFYYRIRMFMKDSNTSTFRRLLLGINLFVSQILLKRLNTLIISGNISGGLVLYHCYYGMICPEKMGENCRIWHGVTIGFNKNRAPIIGNNVTISTSATIIGGIKIGENSIIGPHALVVRNIAPNCVVISEPSYVVKKDGKLVFEKLENSI